MPSFSPVFEHNDSGGTRLICPNCKAHGRWWARSYWAVNEWNLCLNAHNGNIFFNSDALEEFRKL